MRKLTVGLLAIMIVVGLAGCNAPSGDSKGAAGISLSDGPATVEFKGWSISFSQPVVVWSESQSTDLLVLKATATNNTGKEATFNDINNLWAYQKETNADLYAYKQSDSEARLNARKAEANKQNDATAADSTLTADDSGLTSDDVAADGNIYQDFSAGDEPTANGASIDLRYVWKIADKYKGINVDVLGFSPSKDDITISLGDLPDTDEHAKYMAVLQVQNATNSNGDEVTIRGATVSKPDGWKFEDVMTSSVNLAEETMAQETSKNVVKVKFITTAESAHDRAVKYAANYKLAETDVMSVVINGVEWFFFQPPSSRFQAYAQATDGIVNVGSDTMRWDDATPLMNSVTIH